MYDRFIDVYTYTRACMELSKQSIIPGTRGHGSRRGYAGPDAFWGQLPGLHIVPPALNQPQDGSNTHECWGRIFEI